MNLKKPEFTLNENLRFIPKDPTALQIYVEDLKKNLEQTTAPLKRINLLGEIGVYLRQLDRFEEAEKVLEEALKLVAEHNLGIAKETQQKIRLAHVLQEKKAFRESDMLFAEILRMCRESPDAYPYLDFALQHAGKNKLDQGRYQSALNYFSESLELRQKKNSPADQIESTLAAIKRTQELIGKIDAKTLKAYSEKAHEYSQDWLGQPEPSDMYELLQKYFVRRGETADVGCGNGRDANWLSNNGYKVTGYDASLELIQVASKLYPDISFQQSFLPSLQEIQNQFDNVLCETVIMHLPKNLVPEALRNLKRLLKPGGILYLSWRVTEKEDARHSDGRLYSAFEPQFITDEFPQNGILHFEDKISASSGRRVCRLIFKKD